ncbi:CMRF35-like molecule 5 isoform X2 [Megalobrama amblycephala]|uniref:CMRF35-like molecule 5 isoform X2 n=1 Tax=Megalobrama amblycephala TaxID=75352 RepID=UPI002013EBBA|nr:CMRF35-like molecule 5 isoform X2 [Megalobrama amblycephala]
MWDVLLLFSSICTAVVVGAPDTVTGHRGERVEIRCSYKPGYESNSKYFCKGECVIGSKNIMVKSGSPAKDERFSLTDDKKNRVFTVTITDLRTADEGQYWCAVERSLPLTDVYSEILLQVKMDNKTTEASTISPFSNTSSYFSTKEMNPQSTIITHTEKNISSTGHAPHSGSVIYVSVGLVIMVIIFFMTLMVWCRKRSKKPPRVSQTGLSQQVPVEILPLNTTAEISAEDIDWNDHNYQEISEFQCKNKHTTTIYTTAESPDDPIIYSTADKPEDPMIYYTADKPDSTVFSTAEISDDLTIYSTAN